MDNKKFLEQMECTGIVPVIKLENTDDAVNLAKALYDGGIRAAARQFPRLRTDRQKAVRPQRTISLIRRLPAPGRCREPIRAAVIIPHIDDNGCENSEHFHIFYSTLIPAANSRPPAGEFFTGLRIGGYASSFCCERKPEVIQ